VVPRRCVAVLGKGMAIAFALRLAAKHHRDAEPVIIMLKDYITGNSILQAQVRR